MKLKYILRISLAGCLALLVGFGLFAGHANARPKAGSFSMQFRSDARNDGSILEALDEEGQGAWMGARGNSTSSTIFVGDDSRRRATIAILDFDTSPLPDDAYITGAYLQLHVTSFPTRFGNPYTVLGELYADVMPGYYGDSPRLEVDPTGEYADDFSEVYFDMWDYFSHATRAGDNIFVNLENYDSIDPYERTQFAIYFMFYDGYDDNGIYRVCDDPWGICNNNADSLSQGLRFASGNNKRISWRPLLTVFYEYP